MKQKDLFISGKICTKCGIEKHVDEFYDRGYGKGPASRCKDCVLEYQKNKHQTKKANNYQCYLCGSVFKSKYKRNRCDGCKQIPLSVRVYYYHCLGCMKLCVTHIKKNRNYCSHKCYSNNAPHLTKQYNHNCVTCGNVFKTGHPNTKYCSDICQKRLSNIYSGRCKGCDKPYVSRHRREYCSDECYPNTYNPVGPRNVTCDICSKEFTTSNTNSKYCDSCREEARLISKRKRKKKFGNHRRRARTYGVKYQVINRIDVYKRDRYRCQLCNVKVHHNKNRHNDDNYATLDHIIPMSKGGPHTFNNVQTLCRKCNTDKSTSLIGQQPIIFNK